MPPYESNSIFCDYSINNFDRKMPISPSWSINKFISVVSSRIKKDISIYIKENNQLITPSDLNIKTLLGNSLQKEFFIVSNQIEQLCCICLENSSNIIYTPCNHSITCFQCGTHQSITNCPICRTPIEHICYI
jgi:hypothetical protein